VAAGYFFFVKTVTGIIFVTLEYVRENMKMNLECTYNNLKRASWTHQIGNTFYRFILKAKNAKKRVWIVQVNLLHYIK
jgi:hypothetical protein